MLRVILISILSFTYFSSFPIFAQSSQNNLMWSEGACKHSITPAINHGANREYYNAGAQLKWLNYLGDWTDSAHVQQGTNSYTRIEVLDLDQQQKINIDVTVLVEEWTSGLSENKGFFIKSDNYHGSKFYIYSKEFIDPELHPMLTITTNTVSVQIPPLYDTAIASNTYQCSGESDILGVSTPLLFYFDIDKYIPKEAIISNAILSMHTTNNQYGNTKIDVYKVHIQTPNHIEDNLANKYPNDYQMKYDDNVLLVESFESDNWQSKWSSISYQETLEIVYPEQLPDGRALSRKALKVTIPKGEFYGPNISYKFEDKVGQDLDEVFFRYYIKFDTNWEPIDNGKLPGIAGTYAGSSYSGGWGGRRSDGTNGWSARGSFLKPIEGNNPYQGQIPIGNYIYHADQVSTYGDNQIFQVEPLQKERWYAIEQYVKINTPGLNDGVIKNWIDGKLVYENKAYKFREDSFDFIKIDKVWLSFYHGGTIPTNQDITAYIDNIVIAKEYIGPTHFDINLDIVGNEANRSPIIAETFPNTSDIELLVGNSIDFKASVIDPESEDIEITWRVNGDIVSTNTNQLTFQRSLIHLSEVVVELQARDAYGSLNSHQWNIASEEERWSKYEVSQDTYLPTWSYSSLGREETLYIRDESTGLLTFSLPENNIAYDNIKSAYIVLTSLEQFGDQTLVVFQGYKQWKEGNNELEGATRDYLEYSTQEKWEFVLGDWYDALGIENGSISYSETLVTDTDTIKKIYLDVTHLLQEQLSKNSPLEYVIKSQGGKSKYSSKEHPDKTFHPRLIVETYQ